MADGKYGASLAEAALAVASFCSCAGDIQGVCTPKPTTTSGNSASTGTPQLKFGDDDLTLGLNDGGNLQSFKQYGGKGWSGFNSNSSRFDVQINDAMKQADTIRFNLDGVDLSRVNSVNNINEYGSPMNGYTNYELWLIKSNPEYFSKTKFYQGGKEVSPPNY